MSTPRPAAVVVLAAGEGTRMKSAVPKVLHPICGLSMLGHVLAASRELAPEHLVVVVGHGRDQVCAHLAEVAPDALPVVQEPQNGTGHAVRVALDALSSAVGELDGTVLVNYGDGPMLTAGTMRALLDEHARAGNAVTVLSALFPDPAGYGRVVRDASGAVTGIVEQKDASPEQRAIGECNSGVYAFDAKVLRAGLARLSASNAQGEEYLTDVVGMAASDGLPVGAVPAADFRDVLAANDRVQLAGLGRLMNDRLLERAMRAGATVVDPASTWLDVGVSLGRDVVVHPNTQLLGVTSVADRAEVGPSSTLRDTSVGAGARVSYAVCEGASVGAGASVGPFAYLRPDALLAEGSKVGTFVEVKNSSLGAGTKVPHLSYVGDATIGERTNIGAATVFVNYDGVAKHRTVVGSDARTGADNMFVAPVSIGDGAYTAAGSVITQDVPPGALGVGRAPQRNVVGWVERRRAGTAAARAAAAAAAGSGAEGGEAVAGGSGPASGDVDSSPGM